MTISLVSVLAICMAVFAACGKKHNFSKTYTYDNEYHWHACTDKDCKEVKDKAKHTYGKWEVTKNPPQPKRAREPVTAPSAKRNIQKRSPLFKPIP